MLICLLQRKILTDNKDRSQSSHSFGSHLSIGQQGYLSWLIPGLWLVRCHKSCFLIGWHVPKSSVSPAWRVRVVSTTGVIYNTIIHTLTVVTQRKQTYNNHWTFCLMVNKGSTKHGQSCLSVTKTTLETLCKERCMAYAGVYIEEPCFPLLMFFLDCPQTVIKQIKA